MQIYSDKKTKGFTIRDGDVMEWPLTKVLKFAQKYNYFIKPYDDHILSWVDVERMVASVLDQIERRKLPICAVTCPSGRGGLVPAAFIAYALDVPFIPFEDAHKTLTEVLWIDDIIDTGKTAKKYQQYNPKWHFAALCSRWTFHGDAIIGNVLHTPHYIYFPWDPSHD